MLPQSSEPLEDLACEWLAPMIEPTPRHGLEEV